MKDHLDNLGKKPIITPNAPGDGIETMPPPGDERREELKRRMDQLNAEVERIATELQVEGIDPKNWEPDREVRNALGFDGELAVSNARHDYMYVWVHRDPRNQLGGRVVYSYKAEGWEIVCGDMPEAREKLAVTGERWCIDCLLMRMPKERHDALEEKRRRHRLMRETGIDAGLLEQAERHGARVFDLNSMPSYVGMDRSTIRAQAAKKMALDRLGAHIKAGTIPGMQVRR